MNRVILLLYLALISVSAGRAEEAPKYYAIMARANHVGISINLNDVPICTLDTAGYYFSEINSWLLPGKNEISVKVLWPQRSALSKDASIEVSLYLVDMKTQEPSKNYVLIKLPAETDPSTPLVLTQSFEIPFVADLLLAKAEEITQLTDADKQQMTEQVDRLKKALLEKNLDDMYELLKYKMIDTGMARYQPFDLKKWRDGTSDMIKGSRLTAFKYEHEARFEQMGKLVVLSYYEKPKQSAIKINVSLKGENTTWFVPVYFAKIEGNWVIIR